MNSEFLGPEADFIIRLRAIEKKGMTLRSVIVLWAIRSYPGNMGLELSKRLGFEVRGHIQAAIGGLLADGLIEDRRKTDAGRAPNILHITPAGIALLDEIVPHA